MIRLTFVIGPMFWIELIYSLIVIFSCGVIYLRTRELYRLSSHQGIKYFCNAFLFFGLAFFARLFLRLIAIANGPNPVDILLFDSGYLIYLYSVFMSGFYLIYSSIWKKVKDPEKLSLISHPLALSVAAIFIILVFKEISLLIIGCIYLIAAILAYSQKTDKKKGFISHIHILYMLLFTALVLNGVAHLFIAISTQTSFILYAASAAVFLVILNRVMKSTK